MFANKVVLITGASSGIGADSAIEFSKLEANLVITGRNKENLEKIARQCEDVSPKSLKPLAIIADVTVEADVESIINETIVKFGKINILINNAGIFSVGSIETTSLKQYDDVMKTNVRSVYHLTMLTTPYIVETKGNIVNVSSVSGLRSFPNVLAYCVSKAALDQFTRCVALELAPKGVRVNAVNPGVTLTGIHLKGSMSPDDYEAYLEKCKETIALGRPAKVGEITSVIIFLASDAASNITGATLPADGGRHAMCPR